MFAGDHYYRTTTGTRGAQRARDTGTGGTLRPLSTAGCAFAALLKYKTEPGASHTGSALLQRAAESCY